MVDGFYRQLIAILKKHACYLARQGKGSHEIWCSPINHRTFSVPSNCKSRDTANAILKQAGIREKI